MTLLRELGYEFVDLELHDAWLFLEESSAESIISQVLIPWFVPKLHGRLRTFSASGVTNVEASVSEFQRLVTFVHIQSVYRDHIWVRADGDKPGQEAVDAIRKKFAYLDEPHCGTFAEEQFEFYYPSRFKPEVDTTLAVRDKHSKREAKSNLLNKVLKWSNSNPEEAKLEWQHSAAEIINVLKSIQKSVTRVTKKS